MKNSLLKKGLATLLTMCLSLGLFFTDFANLGIDIHTVLAANYGNMTSQGDDTPYWSSSANPPSSITNIPGINVSSQTGRYSMTNGSDGAVWMCIQSSQSSPTGKEGTVYSCSNADTFTDNSGYINALNGLSYSQITVAAYQYGRQSDAAWCYAHTILSYVLSGDSGWYSQICNAIAGREAIRNAAISIASRASGISRSATFYIFVTGNGQNLLAMAYTPTPRSGRVNFNKVDQNGNGVSGAVIQFTTVSGSDISEIQCNVPTTNITNGIQFTTTGSAVQIRGLQPNSVYQFYEFSAPQSYELSDPRTVTFYTDGNGSIDFTRTSSANWDQSTYTYTMTDTETPSGEVSFRKISTKSDGTIIKLQSAVIEFRSVSGTDLSGVIMIPGVCQNYVYDAQANCIRFTTGDGSIDSFDITLRNIPVGQYYFTEVQTPEGLTTAPDRQVTVSANGTCTPGVVQFDDAENQRNPDFSSIEIWKEFTAGTGAYYDEGGCFWDDATNVQFAIQYRGDWATVQEHGWGDSFCYGYVRQVGSGNPGAFHMDEDTGLAYGNVWWDSATRSGAGAYGGASLYSGSNYGIPGRYWQHQDAAGNFVDNEWGAGSLQYLPFGYYRVTESWQEAYMSVEGNRIWIESANLSPEWQLLNNSNGFRRYGVIIKIDGTGTYVCDANGNTISTMPLSGGLRVSRAHNESLTGKIDVNKIDETGNGVDGITFGLYSGDARIATGTVESTSYGQAGDYNTYRVNWTYSYYQSYQNAYSEWLWREVNIQRGYCVEHLNYGTYQLREYITDMRGYRVPDGWQGMDSNGDGVYEYFYKNVTINETSHTDPLTVDCANRQYRIRITNTKIDAWTGQVITTYEGNYEAAFELYVDVNEDGEIDSSDTLIGTVADTDRDGVVVFDYLLEDLFPNVTDPADYPSQWLVREVTAPLDYYLNPTVFRITTNENVGYSASVDVIEVPYTAQIHMYKVDGDTGDIIRNAQFTIYNDVDGDKVYTEGIDTLAHTWSNTEGVHDAQCVWNETLGCYVSSPLRSGNYVVVETGLPTGYFYVGADGEPSLARNEAYFEIAEGDVHNISSAAPVTDVYEETVYNLAPSIGTTFHDPVTMSHNAYIDDDIELIDTVNYTNLIPNVEVRLDAVVMVRETGLPLLDADGNEVTGYRVFTPSTSDGTVDVSIHLDTNYIMSLIEDGTLSASVDLVCFETLNFTATTDLTPYHQWYYDNPIAEHQEIDDQGQTVRVGVTPTPEVTPPPEATPTPVVTPPVPTVTKTPTPTPSTPETPPKTGDFSGYEGLVMGAVVAVAIASLGIIWIAIMNRRRNNGDDYENRS